MDRDPYEVAGSHPVDGCSVGATFASCCGTQDYIDHGTAGTPRENDVPVCRCSDSAGSCSGNGDTPIDTMACAGTPVGGGPGGTTGASTGGGSCDYSKWKDYCDLGCGDLGCVKFCESCDAFCEATCDHDADCSAIGAGLCKHSETTNQGVCTKQPTVCP